MRVVVLEDDLRSFVVRGGNVFMHEFPAVGLHARHSGGGGGVGVEGLGVVQGGRRAWGRGDQRQGDVVEVVVGGRV